MRKKTKKYLSLCMSVALTAASVNYAGMVPAEKNAPAPRSRAVASDYTSAGLPEQPFAMLTISGDKTGISADGKKVGNNYGGISVSDDKTITITADGKTMTLDEAKKEIGCQVMTDKNGDMVITSPFQTARLIVMSDNSFDDRGASSVEEKVEGIYLLTYGTSAEAYKAYLSLSEDTAITSVEPDAVLKSMETEEDDEEFVLDSWGRNKIGAPEYCEWLKNEVEELPEVKVAVIDTGIYAEHTAFEGRILDGGASFVFGYDDSPADRQGHGTHCAGIICQSTNDNVKILPVQVLDKEGYGSTLDIYCGMMYAIEQGVDVMSMSLGGYGKSALFDEAVLAAKKNDITLCIAAGNEMMDSAAYFSSLASSESPVVVASVDSTLNPSWFSNYGPTIDFAAPGEAINSAAISDSDSTIKMSGTSMATPFVAAVFADVYSYNIEFTADQAYEAVRANAVDLLEPGFDDLTGWGLVNLKDMDFNKIRVEKPAFDFYSDGETHETSYGHTMDVVLSISCQTEGAVIYYTLDGSEPTTESAVFTEPITLTESARVRAIAIADGTASPENTQYFAVGEITPEAILIKDGVIVDYAGMDSELDLAAMVEAGEIPEFTEIGAGAFNNAFNLTKLILPDSVKEIGTGAFEDCTGIEEIVTKAEIIGENAFLNCMFLETIEDANIKSVGTAAFAGCEALANADFTKLTEIPDSAFAHCTAITSDMFSLSKVTKIGDTAFYNSGLIGKIDVSKAQSIGTYAFSETDIEEIKFSKTMTKLPEGVLYGASSIKKISAPAVTVLTLDSLSLGKTEFTEETKVQCDIDFSKVVKADANCFRGYVFDKPVSFDSLDPSTYVNVVAEAYGEYIALPTLTSVYNIAEDEMAYYSEDMFVDVLDLSNAEDIYFEEWVNFNIILINDNTQLLGDPQSFGYGMFVTPSENAPNWFEGDVLYTGARFSSGPSVFFRKSYLETFEGNDLVVKPIFYNCEEAQFDWYRVSYSSGEDFDFDEDYEYTYSEEDNEYTEDFEYEYPDEDGEYEYPDEDGEYEYPDEDFEYELPDIASPDYPYDKVLIEVDDPMAPFVIDSSEPGYYTYVLRQGNEKLGIKTFEFDVNINYIPRYEITENSVNTLPLAYNTADLPSVGEVTFTAPKTGTYKFVYGGYSLTIFDGEEQVGFLPFAVRNEETVELKKGKTYTFKMESPATNDETMHPVNISKLYLAVLTDDCDLADKTIISQCAEYYDFDTSDFDGTFPYMPKLILTDIVTLECMELEYGVDYIIDEGVEIGYGVNTFTVTGIGNYYGQLSDAVMVLNPDAKVGETVTITPVAYATFTAPESGIYNVAVKPTDEMIEKAIEKGTFVHAIDFSPVLCIRGVVNGIYYDDLTPMAGDLSANCTFTPDMTVFSIEMSEGEEYVLSTYYGDMNIEISQAKTVSDLDISYEMNYEFNDKPVEPVISIKDRKTGKDLKAGKDFDLTVWNNGQPGLMYAYAELKGDYTGGIPMAMAVGDCGFEVTKYNGTTVLSIQPDVPFTPYGDFIYKIDIPYNDMELTFNAVNSNLTFASARIIDPVSGEIIDMYEELDTAKTFFAGTYFLDIDCNDDMNSIFDIGIDDDFDFDFDFDDLVVNGAKEAEDGEFADDDFDFGEDFEFSDEPDVFVFRETVDKINICDASLDVTFDPSVPGFPAPTLTYDGRELELFEDYDYDYESTSPGTYTTIIKGCAESGFYGTMPYSYIVFPEEEDIITLTDGEPCSFTVSDKYITFDLDNGAVETFRWTPEKEHNILRTSTYKPVYVEIADCDANLVYAGKINKNVPADFMTEAGKEYFIFLSANIGLKSDLVITNEYLLTDCTIESAYYMSLEDGSATPEVKITDGDYELIEGVDYVFANEKYVDVLGKQIYIIRGIGSYTGELEVNVYGYTEKFPEEVDVTDMPLNAVSVGGTLLGPGDIKYFSFTGTQEGVTDYRAGTYTDFQYGVTTRFATIYLYDGDKNFIGCSANMIDFQLAEGETVYFAVTSTLEVDSMEQVMEIPPFFMVNINEYPFVPEETTTTAPEPGTGENTTTTAAPVGGEDTTTTQPTTTVVDHDCTTTAAPVGGEDTTKTAAPAGANGSTTTTAPDTTKPGEEGELPDTGYSGWHSVAAALAAAITAFGALTVYETRKKENE